MSDMSTTKKLLGLLSEKHPAEQWAFFPELGNASGYLSDRRIDAFAIQLWSSASKHATGWSIAYEIKIARSDFMNEIKDPEKRKKFVDMSNEFYYVTPPGLLNPSEIPEECGLIEGTTSLKVKKIAQQRSNIMYSPEFFSSLCEREDKRDPQHYKAFKYVGNEVSLTDLRNIFRDEKEKLLNDAKRLVRDEIFNECQNRFHRQMYEQLSLLLRQGFNIEKPYYGFTIKKDSSMSEKDKIIENLFHELIENIQKAKNGLLHEENLSKKSEIRQHLGVALKLVDAL